VLDQLLRQGHEVRGLGDEVGLTVELEQRPAGVRDQTVGGGAAGPLADVLGALDPQELDGLVEVTVRLVERLLAVHHSGAGEVAELLHVRGGVVSHDSLS
jgi:hypothetical protein